MTQAERNRRQATCRECARLRAEIDAGCNDCAQFQRGRMIKTIGAKVFTGTCGKTGESTTAAPGFCEPKECFQPRRTEEMPHTCVMETTEEIRESLVRFRDKMASRVADYAQAIEGSAR